MAEKTAVLIRTLHPLPDPTELSYAWADTVKQQFDANGWQLIDLAANDAIASQVNSTLQNTQGGVVMFYGHGFPSCMIGQNWEESVINLEDVTLLKNQKVYVMACWTAQQLGQEADKIARCYLGYDHEVIAWLNPPYSDHIGECVNKGILELLNTVDCTFKQARQQIMAEYDRWIDYFTHGEGATDTESVGFAADLRHNRDALRLLGDAQATL